MTAWTGGKGGGGREFQKGGNIWILMADSCRGTAETKATQ